MTIQDMLNNKDYQSVYILARYFYRIGEPFLSDSQYDQMESLLKQYRYNELKAYFNRTYDDDPVPLELLQQIGVEPVKFTDLTGREELLTSMNEDKSLSIHSVTSYEEAWDFFSRLREYQQDFMSSLKMDGDNTKMLYVDGEYALSMSRGRKGTSFDFTDQSAKVMPSRIQTTQHHLRVFGESYVLEEALPILRNEYDPSKYKTCKSAAISMLRVRHKSEHYKYLKTRVFFAEGLENTLHEMFDNLESQGIDTAPHKLFKWESIPESFEEFKVWLKQEIFDYFEAAGQGIPSDGVVVEVDDLLWIGEQKEQYNNRQLALKFEQWGYKYEKGVITGIRVEQQRVYKSVRVTIEPVVQYDGCTATIINVFDPSILIRNNLCVGETVYFEKNSGAVNILIHGEKLKSIEKEE